MKESAKTLDLWLIRHAESVGNLNGTQADTELSPRGLEQAKALKNILQLHDFQTIWTSPLLRACQTASHALPNKIPTIDPQLSEFKPPVQTQFLDTSKMGLADLDRIVATPSMPMGEMGMQFKMRVQGWLKELPVSGQIIVFSHFAVIREMLNVVCISRKFPQEIAHTGIFRLAITKQSTEVLMWNDTVHLNS